MLLLFYLKFVLTLILKNPEESINLLEFQKRT